MRWIPITQCVPGMRLGKKIYNEEGLTLLSEHVELTAGIINRLMQYGIDHIYIQDPLTEDIHIPDMITDETRRQAMSVVRSNFRQMMDGTQRKSVGALGKEFRSVLNMLIDDLAQHKDAMVMLTNMHVTDFYLYQHSLNVCIYSTVLGMSRGYNRDQLMTIGLGALLHDIGKTQIPLDVLNKPGKLTQLEFEIVKTHAEIGYKLLKDEPNIPLLSAHCAYQHHERMNGSGYPRGIVGEEIHEYSRLIGIVDSYDAMTSNRVYRNALLPHQALEILYTGAEGLYELPLIELFRDRVAVYPLGMSVTLNTGEKGIVVDLNSSYPHRPIVRILTDEQGRAIDEVFEIDMSKKLTYMIIDVDADLTEMASYK